MRKLATAILTAASLALASCAGIGGALLSTALSDSKPAVAIGDKVLVQGTNALADAADAYAVAANAAAVAVRAGVGTDDQLRMLRTLNNQALSLINNANSGLTIAERAASLTLVVSQLRSIAAGAR